MIRIRDLSLSYGNKVVLDGLDLDIPLQGVTCLRGPSGCGKTTLLRVLAGLEKARKGRIDGLPEKIAYLFQEDRLLPWCTALENVAAVLPKAERARATEFLKLVELEGEESSLPTALSGGMQRRLALARTLAFGGDLLLLDEPFKGLDPALTWRIAEKIKNARVPVLAVTHAQEECEALGGRIIALSGPPLERRP